MTKNIKTKARNVSFENTGSPNISDVLHNLVPFVQFKKRAKHLWRSVTFGKFAGFNLPLY